MTFIYSHFNLDEQTEISIEANPEDITEAFAAELFKAGFNRISLGVQSLNNKVLDKIGRQHSSQQALNALKYILKAGFENINVDFMFAIPELDLTILKKDLLKLLSFQPTHVSSYCLNIEPKTILAQNNNWIQWQILKMPQRIRKKL